MPTTARTALDPALVARLQAQASRNPTAYRWRLAALAIAGDLALTITQVIPVALPIVIGVMYINRPLFYWLGAGAVIFLMWLVQPNFRSHGREITREEAPKLFTEIDLLREKLQSRGRMQVLLDDAFNASAGETHGVLGLVGTRCVLTLGVPLLAALSREQLLAVIAHEFGHFSRRHGRLGQWLYRARAGWIAFAEQVQQSGSAFNRMAAWYAEQFVPYFSVRSFVNSRQCEYEADADGAHAVGSRSFADALSRVVVASRLWDEAFPQELARLQMAEQKPPSDMYERFLATAREWPATTLQEWLDKALQTPSNWLDTHPSLRERLNALREEPRVTFAASSAGYALLGNAWPRVLAEFNAQWLRKVEPDWLIEHLRLKHVAQPLLRADQQLVETWPKEARLARAKAIRTVDRPRGLAELRALHLAHPGDVHIVFAYGSALLNEDDQSGAPLLEDLAKAHATFRQPAYVRLYGYYERQGNSEQSDRQLALLNRSAERRAAAERAFFAEIESGRRNESSLTADVQTVLNEATTMDPTVTSAWMFEGQAPLVTDTTGNSVPIKMHALFLTNNPLELNRNDVYQTDVIARYEQALTSLIPPDEHAVVRAFYTTEPVPQTLQPLSSRVLKARNP